ncbi:2-succinyl-6-hydroxy-2,4-cyclohexadiene-1-carboxylate synthase [Martelella alba]|uniref:Putative 2-succinyl-6-hydroxy-2,4-cyclohexadiene-1-carboxylate synthase n=1 Tax=Martelella alba TaxID=2590451 RepID=A0ABY2SJC9_9HYPH|nr:2-succinyl-6-hydroxy-2,4-cyclohexadiene-1-carboxylate synthase [Martelella alba]TKI04778.1 2-succinyl-6-hydroxy-2,4-cyclohexadiene-1-carboxylate synthase [Martelella alba]
MTWAIREQRPGKAGRPWLVWLHGLLGDGRDWAPALPFFADWPLAVVDLPGHGDSFTRGAADFAEVSRGLSHTLAAAGIKTYILIGYSLGGRIALYHACLARPPGLRAVFAEGAHPGLPRHGERAERLRHDRAWARRFAQEPLARVLADWYRQPVFAELSADKRQALVELRRHNRGDAVAAMLMATSLGRQPDLLPLLPSLPIPFGYLCGEYDDKFSALARRCALPFLTVRGAGHNSHRANPSAFADRLLTLLAPLA